MQRPGIVTLPVFFTSLLATKISFLPAFVAGFKRVLIMQRPGIVTLPVFFTSLLATPVRASSTFDASDFFSPAASATACARAPLDSALTPFIAFIAFIGAMAAWVGATQTKRRAQELEEG